MEELKPLFNAIMAQFIWGESDSSLSSLAQEDMRERCANVAVDVAKLLLRERDKRIAELEGTMADLLAKAQSAENAAWEAYCRTPTRVTWDLYVRSERHKNGMAVLKSSLERLAELEDRNALLDGNFEISSNVAIGLAERYQQELAQARQRIAELEAQLTAMEENFQAVRRDRDELEQELLGLKHWQPA